MYKDYIGFRLIPLLLESCVASKSNQQWKCGSGENSKQIQLINDPWVVSFGSTDFQQAAAYYLAPMKSVGAFGDWIAVDSSNHSHKALLCTMHTHR